MLLDQRCAGGENRRKSQKQAPDDRAEAGGNKPGNDCYGPAESNTNKVIIPLGYAQSRRVETDYHGSRNRMAERPKAAANQIRKAALVAAQDDSINLLSKTQTVQLYAASARAPTIIDRPSTPAKGASFCDRVIM